MNKVMKTSLDAVIKGLVNDDPKMASDALHEYLRVKAQAILLGEQEEDMDDEEGDEKHDDEEGDEKRAARDEEDAGEDREDAAKDEKCEECGMEPCECDDEMEDKKEMKESTTPHGKSVKGSLDSKGRGKHFAATGKGATTPHGSSVKGSHDHKNEGKYFHSAPKGDTGKKGAAVRGSYDGK